MNVTFVIISFQLLVFLFFIKMKDFVYYPIYVTTLNRYEHFRRLVESLQRNTDVDKTEFIIGLDYPPSVEYKSGYEKIRKYIPSITGFKKVTVFPTNINLGQYANGMRLRDYIKNQGFDGYIGTEDDNEFSPNFIQYMNWCLNYFRDDQSIYAICSCMNIDVSGIKNNIYKLNHAFSGWGIGMWFSRYNKLEKYRDLSYQKKILDSISVYCIFSNRIYFVDRILGMLRGGWPYGDTLPMFLPFNERWCIFPKLNKVRNWGGDGSGQHGGTAEVFEKYSTLPIDEDEVFVPQISGDIYSSIMQDRLNEAYKHSWRDYFRAVVLFIIYKVTGKILVIKKTKGWPKIKLQKAL